MPRQEIIPCDPPDAGKALEPRTLRRNEARVQRGFWAKLRRHCGRVPFIEEAIGAYYCAFDPATPRPVKAMLLAALAYFVVPTDLIPDFVAGLGFTDDAAVLFATLRMVANHITDDHRERARRRLTDLGLRDQTTGEASPPPETGKGG